MKVKALQNVHDGIGCYTPGQEFEWQGSQSDAIMYQDRGQILILDPGLSNAAPNYTPDASLLSLVDSLKKEKADLLDEVNDLRNQVSAGCAFAEEVFGAFGVPMTDATFNAGEEITKLCDEVDAFRAKEREAGETAAVNLDEGGTPAKVDNPPQSDTPPTMAELRAQGKALKLEFKHNISRVDLEKMIAAKIAKGDS